MVGDGIVPRGLVQSPSQTTTLMPRYGHEVGESCNTYSSFGLV